MIKTIQTNKSIDIFEKLVNQFEIDSLNKGDIIFSMQTHVNTLEGLPTIYTAIISYRTKRQIIANMETD
jgi:hypothetical protein